MTACEKIFKILSILIDYIRGLSLYIHQNQDLDFLSQTPKSVSEEIALVWVMLAWSFWICRTSWAQGQTSPGASSFFLLDRPD
jgi:hypothetical protein